MSRQTTTRRRHGVRRMSERKRLTITAITAVLALVTVVICALSGVFNFHKGNERILPNLVGQTEESAKTQLAELDAEPSITYENSDETKGIVIRQDVNEGTQLKHRQTVAFVVSLGPKEQPRRRRTPRSRSPSFVGLTLEQAQATAKSLGVTVEAGGNVYDDNVRKGSIARQNPVGGTMVKPGTTIQVSISAGPEKKEYTVTVTCGAGGQRQPERQSESGRGRQRVVHDHTEGRLRGCDAGHRRHYGPAADELFLYERGQQPHALCDVPRKVTRKFHAPPAAGRGRMIYVSGMAWMPTERTAPSSVSMQAYVHAGPTPAVPGLTTYSPCMVSLMAWCVCPKSTMSAPAK